MVNPMTFLIFIIVIYQSLHANDLRRLSFLLFVDSLAFALLANSGYFIKIGSLSLEYDEALMICFITILIISGGMWRIRSSVFVKSLALLVTVSIGLYLLAVNPINILVLPIGGSWDIYYVGSYVLEPLAFSVRNSERLFRLVLFIIVVIGLNDLTQSRKFRLELIKAIIVITVLQTVLGYLDLGTKLFFHQPVLQSLATSLLGQGASQYHSIGKRAGAYFIQALMKEPSHFAVSLVPGLTVFALSKKRNISKSLLEIALVVILFLSGSFAGFAIIFYWLTLKLFRYVLESKLGRIISFAIAIGVLILIVFLIGMLADIIPLLGYYLSRLSGLIGIGPSIGSEAVRLYSIKSWKDNWEFLTTYFAYPKEIRTLIYTTNPIESSNGQLKKVTKNRGVLPNDMALMKQAYLAINNISKKEKFIKLPFFAFVYIFIFLAPIYQTITCRYPNTITFDPEVTR